MRSMKTPGQLANLLRGALLGSALLLGSMTHAALDFPRAALLGTFEGDLVIGRDDMKLAFTFVEDGEGFGARLTSANMGLYGLPADMVKVDENDIIIRIPRLDLEFTGTVRLTEDEKEITRIDGDWFQHSELVPVILLPVAAPSF